MQPFNVLSGVAAPLPMINVDTDMIIPKQFLKTILRTGLGAHLFEELRRRPDNTEISDFPLNKSKWRQAVILVSGANFGCGSSREHAPWALLDYGIRCIIAPSFADIFYNNCFKNGILPVVLPEAAVNTLIKNLEQQPGSSLTVDLPSQTITDAGENHHYFTIDAFRKESLLHGLDDIGLTLRQQPHITAFEERRHQSAPWLDLF
jgi:3-isopropylmalate/(R)-2-methylmalate dehydratase small subunit